MARTWLSIDVELVAGRGQDFWPRPGRTLVARRTFTFRQLADAINDAFGRWDRAHLHLFDVGDTLIVPLDRWDDPPRRAVDDSANLSMLELGQQFVFEFDLGDSWEHLCTVGPQRVDPAGVLGIEPDRPLPAFGWGDLPDQYGRRFRGDDGAGDIPAPPDPPLGDLPPLRPYWGPRGDGTDARPTGGTTAQEWDDESTGALRGAVERGDGQAVVDLLHTRNALDVGQWAGDGLVVALDQGLPDSWAPAVRLADDLRTRSRPGDDLLADELDAARGVIDPPDLRPVPVSLGELATYLEGDPTSDEGWRIDLDTGQWWPTDPLTLIGEDPPAHWEDDDAWLDVRTIGSRDGWQDMSAFIDTVDDPDLVAQLERAIHGRGAFRRFKDVLWPHEQLRHAWFRFADDRQRGRAREWLAEHGLRPAPPPVPDQPRA